MVNLDTHVLVHALSGALRPRERAVLEKEPWSIPATVLWELAKLVQLGRLTMDLGSGKTIRALSGIHVWPLDLTVAKVPLA